MNKKKNSIFFFFGIISAKFIYTMAGYIDNDTNDFEGYMTFKSRVSSLFDKASDMVKTGVLMSMF